MSIANDTLTAADFGRFFRELWDCEPYDWQQRLAEQVMQSAGDAWPAAIALPTAAGKTACIDIAVFALAALADAASGTSPHPRRIFYAVDRRNIVDQTYDRAKRIADKLANADADSDSDSGIVKAVADRLRRLAGGDEPWPLAVHRLRGGIRGASGWERNPRQPAVITTTVDQVGSSLLFGAYGKGARTWPVYAGLAANDSIIILDEAHCAQPFLQTLRAVGKYRQWAQAGPGTPFRVVIMSATPPCDIAKSDVFRDISGQPADAKHGLGRRQLASKPATLAVAKRVARGGNPLAALGQELADAALELAGPDIRLVVVFANRVATARATYRIIKEQDKTDAVLITGRMRQRGRECVMGVLERAKPGADAEVRAGDRPLIVVATQTLEIGADLDFDGLITECASLDALRQRFGRLNRTGRAIPAPGRIIIRADQVDAKADDPIYGGAISATWQWLKLNVQANAFGNDIVDFGIANIDRLLDGADTARLAAPAKDATVMLPAHIDAWSQTGPEPRTGPAPALDTYLHGVSTAPADVQVCWRAGLDLTDRDQVQAILQFCPPSSMELAPVPLAAFRKWLAAAATFDDDDTGDAPGETANEIETRAVGDDRGGRWQVIIANRPQGDQALITANPRRIRPGDTVVIPTEHSGNPRAIVDMLPDDAALLDIGDAAMRAGRGKPTLRLMVEHLAGADAEVSELFGEIRESESAADAQLLTRELLELLADPEVVGIPAPVKCSASALRQIAGGWRLYQFGRQLIIQSRRAQSSAGVDVEQPDDADDVTHSRRSRPVGLAAHSRGVRDWAVAYARGCGIGGPELEAIRCAALLHDIGKADPLFQQAMHHGNPFYAAAEPLAKSPDAINPKVRHELMSVRMAESNGELLPANSDARDLALHLIASHHGYCRPFAPFREADLDPDSASRRAEFEIDGALLRWDGPTGLERLDSGVAERFWRLTRRYGWWGLAYLEAILRVADWSRSQWEEEHPDVY